MLAANKAFSLAIAIGVDDMTASEVDKRVAKALDALNGKPEKRTNTDGQRLVALRCIHKWFEYPSVQATWQTKELAPDDKWLAIDRHAAWLASEVYERQNELYPDEFSTDGNPEPWSWGVDAAAALIQVWADNGKWSALNRLLACWKLGLTEPESPRNDSERHPLEQWWRNHRKTAASRNPMG